MRLNFKYSPRKSIRFFLTTYVLLLIDLTCGKTKVVASYYNGDIFPIIYGITRNIARKNSFMQRIAIRVQRSNSFI